VLLSYRILSWLLAKVFSRLSPRSRPDSSFASDWAKRWPGGGVKAGLQLGFDAFSIYNIAPHTLSLIGVLPANDGALNIHPWRNDARSHYQ
jgi:hypothetical protein